METACSWEKLHVVAPANSCIQRLCTSSLPIAYATYRPLGEIATSPTCPLSVSFVICTLLGSAWRALHFQNHATPAPASIMTVRLAAASTHQRCAFDPSVSCLAAARSARNSAAVV